MTTKINKVKEQVINGADAWTMTLTQVVSLTRFPQLCPPPFV